MVITEDLAGIFYEEDDFRSSSGLGFKSGNALLSDLYNVPASRVNAKGQRLSLPTWQKKCRSCRILNPVNPSNYAKLLKNRWVPYSTVAGKRTYERDSREWLKYRIKRAQGLTISRRLVHRPHTPNRQGKKHFKRVPAYTRS